MLGVWALVLAGCDIPKIAIPVPSVLKGKPKKKARYPWKERRLPLPALGKPVEVRLSLRGNGGKVRLWEEAVAGAEIGSLAWEGRDRKKKVWRGVWRPILVDLAEIRWSSGDRWLLFVWDAKENTWDARQDVWYRTISLFDPALQEVFACQLTFRKKDRTFWSRDVDYAFSWNLALVPNAPHRAFLDSIKEGYAEGSTWCQATPGLDQLRSDHLGSMTLRLSRDTIMADLLARPFLRPPSE